MTASTVVSLKKCESVRFRPVSFKGRVTPVRVRGDIGRPTVDDDGHADAEDGALPHEPCLLVARHLVEIRPQNERDFRSLTALDGVNG